MSHFLIIQIMKRQLVTIFLVIITSQYLCAQNETHWLPEQPGKWSFHHTIHGEIEKYKLTPAELATYQSKIDAIAETFHQNPVLKNPVGFEPSLNVLVWPHDKLGYKTISLANAIIESRIAIQFCPYFRDEAGNVKKHCTEVTSCDIHLNQPEATAENHLNYSASEVNPASEQLEIAAQKLSKIFIEPLVEKELDKGVVAYSSGIIIVSNPDRPYWIPVKAGALFDEILAYYRLVMEQDDSYSFVVEDIKKEKASLTPEELNGPAYYESGNISHVTATPNNSQLKRFNPDYFDKSLPRTAIQIIAIHTLTEAFSKECDYNHIEYQRHCEFVKQLDAKALKALIDVK